jgi:hypothetical protein
VDNENHLVSQYIYYKNAGINNWELDKKFDTEPYRVHVKAINPDGIKLKKVFGDKAISW